MAVSIASKHAVRRWGAGTAAIARALIAANAPLTGVAIAELVGVSQPRVSQVLKQFAERQAVRATEDGYVGRTAKLLDLYRRRARPTVVQPETYWYSTRPMSDQAARIVGSRARAGSSLPSPPTSHQISSSPGDTRHSPSCTRAMC